MRSFFTRGAVLAASLFVSIASCSGSSSKLVLPADFAPPQVFKNANLLRTIDLTKPYVRETIAIIVENISNEPQAEYYLPVPKDLVPKISYVEAKDKKGSGAAFEVTPVELDGESDTQYYRILISPPIGLGASSTIQINLATTEQLSPVPAEINQGDKQFLQWTGSQYFPSAYSTQKQKTKLKLPNNEVPDFTKLSPKKDGTEDPTKSGSQFTFGPYKVVTPEDKGGESVSVRFDYTAPVIRMDRMERDIEVSHWGGNLAIEERYWMTNIGAKLKNHFSRVSWAASSYYKPATAAIKDLTFPLQVGAKDPYFTDEIGNVSTSRFRSNFREANLELRPRYPVFGGWNYSFVVGWNHELKDFLRTQSNGEDFVLKVPFLEGPKESVTYGELEVTVILPEGATNVQYSAPIPLLKQEQYLHKTFMDTVGRTAIKLTAYNVVDEQHRKELIVTYHYPKAAIFRKPFVLVTAALTLFMASWIFSKINVKIGK
ncbi:dolichyl-diphosphooligosaccharide--protein glycosyltransferase subunit 1 [Rhizina undulata]